MAATWDQRRRAVRAPGGAAVAALLVVLAGPAPAGAFPEGHPQVQWRSTIGAPVVAPPSWCSGVAEGLRSEAMPLIGVDPDDPSSVRATWSAHGEHAQVAGASEDGGRTWTAAPIDRATSCTGGDRERKWSVNALFDVGAGGRAWFGQSWVGLPTGADQPLFRFGVQLHALGPGAPATTPAGAESDTQNLAVAAHPTDPQRIAVAWTAIRQVPNPVTYTPAPSSVRFTESQDGGLTWSDQVVVHQAPPGEVVVNTRLVRASDGGLVVLFDQAELKEFPGAQLLRDPADFTFFASHSEDGRTFAPPVRLGRAPFHVAQRPDGGEQPTLVAVKPDLAAGPDGSVAAVWHDGARATVPLVRSHDGGRSWLPETATVDLPSLPYQVAVAIDGRGRVGLSWYDFRQDRLDDEEWTLQPRGAIQRRDGRWAELALDDAFDLAAAESCQGGPPPLPTECEPPAHAGPLGVTQDLEGLPNGFLAAYTVAGALVSDGFTDARVARIR